MFFRMMLECKEVADSNRCARQNAECEEGIFRLSGSANVIRVRRRDDVPSFSFF